MAPRYDVNSFEVPDLVDPVIGWRVWKIVHTDEDELRLRSPWYPNVWEPREDFVAKCNYTARNTDESTREPHPIPVFRHPSKYGHSHNCGIWSLKTRLGVWAWWRMIAREGSGWVIGRVQLWGRVIEGDDGWRGAKAYPLDLMPMDGSYFPDSVKWVTELREIYL